MKNVNMKLSLFLTFILVCFAAGCSKVNYPPGDVEQEPAFDLRADAECSNIEPGKGIVRLNWTLPDRRGNSQSVEATRFRNGEFQTIAELPGDSSSVSWDEGAIGVNYYWRVLTESQDGWVSSDTARFEVPVCPVDLRDESQ